MGILAFFGLMTYAQHEAVMHEAVLDEQAKTAEYIHKFTNSEKEVRRLTDAYNKEKAELEEAVSVQKGFYENAHERAEKLFKEGVDYRTTAEGDIATRDEKIADLEDQLKDAQKNLNSQIENNRLLQEEFDAYKNNAVKKATKKPTKPKTTTLKKAPASKVAKPEAAKKLDKPATETGWNGK